MKKPYNILILALVYTLAVLPEISCMTVAADTDLSGKGIQEMSRESLSGIEGEEVPGGTAVLGTVVSRGDSTLLLSFDITASHKAGRKGATVVYIPQVTDGEYTVSFDPVVVQGRRSRTAWERHEWAARETAAYENTLYLKPGETARYRSEIPWQQWMGGAGFWAEISVAGCCSALNERVELFPENTLPSREPTTDAIPAITGKDKQVEPVHPLESEPAPVITVADSIAEVFTFVLPAEEFDPENPIRLYDDERDNAIIIYYHINSYEIEPGYAGNRQTLANLLASIDIILNSAGSSINRVTVAGFASPDGPFELNDRLAWERAVSVKEYIMKNSGLPDELISLYNGSADWQGLRLMVSSDPAMPHREEVLDIIDNTPVWDPERKSGRNTALRSLHDGEPYRYMAEHIFPKLRNGAFIRVYYDNYPKRNNQ